MDRLQRLLTKLTAANIELAEYGLDAILTEHGPVLVGDARFSVPFSEARYRSLIDRLDVLVLELTASGEIVYCNEATSRITGIPAQVLLAANFREIIKPCTSTMTVDRLCSEFINNVELVDYQTSVVTADNSHKVISWQTFDVFNNEQQLDRIIYFGIDITQEQQDKEALAIGAIAFNSNLAMTICDSKCNILRINEAYTKLTGFTASDVLGKTCEDFASERNPVDFYAEKCKIFKEKGNWAGNLWCIDKNGEDYLEFRSVNAVRNTEGQVTHLVSTHKNISKNEIIEKKLNIASVAFEAAQSMFITDAQGLITHINSAFTETTGYTLTELIGKSSNILKSDIHDSSFYEEMWADINAIGCWSGELWSKRKNGEIYLEQLNVVQVTDSESNVTNYVSTFTDRTENIAYKKGLIEAKEKAERFSTLKSQFIASMSHEIRTPMTAIIGFSELALNQDMSEKVQAYVEKINIASNSLLGILQDILDFTKLGAGRVVIDALPFNILDLLSTIHTLFSGAAQQKGLEFTIVRDSVIPFEWIGDKLRLQQVLINLVGNAIKFTAQGSVKLEITLQTMTSSHMQLLFCVTDTGIGISLEDQSKLFIEFSQVDGSISRQYGGTGLGLVISKELVELMGGEISVLSHTNEGSTFSFALQFDLNKTSVGHNADLTNQGHKVRKSLDSNKFKGHRVLVVDDNEGTQALIQEYLHDLGIVTEVAEHGLAALTMLEQHEFDVVLMDIHMPIMNGLEATQRIHQQEKYATLPIIALSAGVTEAERNNCIARGMVGFISKPIDVEQLCTVLELWLKPRI
jgi:PAS domain S-box-containing protein